MNKTAYVAGRVTGLPHDEVATKFNHIAEQLNGQGYRVVRPLAVYDASQTWDEAIRGDIKRMLDCDEVHLLPDWQESRGAQLERDIAVRLGMQVVYH
jgi:hypothetical protein